MLPHGKREGAARRERGCCTERKKLPERERLLCLSLHMRDRGSHRDRERLRHHAFSDWFNKPEKLDNFLPFVGNGFYDAYLVDYGVKSGIVTKNDLQYKRNNTLEPNI